MNHLSLQHNNDQKKSHKNFFIFSAENNYDLGEKMGARFRIECQASVSESSKHPYWIQKKEIAQSRIALHMEQFPQYITELQGYASGAHVDFLDLFTLSLEDEVDSALGEHCTSIIAGQGSLIGHNEDWDESSANDICIVQKTIQDTTILELYYYNTLGGNACSINSYGYISMVNSLPFQHTSPGISKNFLARFLSETNNPATDSKKITRIPKMSAYSVTLARSPIEIFNIEFDATRTTKRKITPPFVHTNHFLFRDNPPLPDEVSTTFDRFAVAQENISVIRSMHELETLTETSAGNSSDILNVRTLARVLVHIENKKVHIWLRRENERGFITYPLPF